jgi:hypothetical protein
MADGSFRSMNWYKMDFTDIHIVMGTDDTETVRRQTLETTVRKSQETTSNLLDV